MGILRTFIGFPIEQPMESTKIQWQANPTKANEFHVVRDIYREKGIYKGFYSGSLPNVAVRMLKNTYRYPLMVGLPHLFETKLNLGNLHI